MTKDKCNVCLGDGCLPYTDPTTDVEKWAICSACGGEGCDRLLDISSNLTVVKRSGLIGEPINLFDSRDDLMEAFGDGLVSLHPEWFSDSYKSKLVLSGEEQLPWMDERAQRGLADYFTFLALGAEGDKIQRFKNDGIHGEVILRGSRVVTLLVSGVTK